MDLACIGDPHGETTDIDTDSTDYLFIPGDIGTYQEARNVLGHYNDLDVETYVVPGNHDVRNFGDVFDRLLDRYDNIESVDDGYVTLSDGDEEYDVVGYGAHTFYLGPESLDEWDIRQHEFENWPETYLDRRNGLEQTLEQTDNPVILLSHNVPFDSGVDTLDSPMARKVRRYGLPWGSDVLSNTIDAYEDDIVLNVGGHIHEGRGLGKTGSVPVINTGQNDLTNITLENGNIADIDFK